MTKAVSDTLELIVNITLIVTGIGMAAIPLAREIREDAPIEIGKEVQFAPGRKIFTPMGKFFIVCVAIALSAGVIKYVVDSQASRRMQDDVSALRVAHANDSMQHISDKKDEKIQELERKTEVLNVQGTVNGLKDTVNDLKHIVKEKAFEYSNLSLKLQESDKDKLALQKQVNSPVMEEYIPQTVFLNPHLSNDTSRRIYNYIIWYINSGEGKATHIRFKTYFIDIDDNAAYISDSLSGFYTEDGDILDKNVPKGYTIMATYSSKHIGKPCLLAFEMRYKNIFDQEMKPYRKILIFDTSYSEKQVPKIPKISNKFITDYLVKNRYWQPI